VKRLVSEKKEDQMSMNNNSSNPLHQPETEWQGEIQQFSGPALAPDHPSLEPRVRRGRPAKPPETDSTNGSADQNEPSEG
jgi:hypothetical protein